MKMMMFNQEQNTVRPVTFNFTESTENVFTLRLLMATDQQKHVRFSEYFLENIHLHFSGRLSLSLILYTSVHVNILTHSDSDF